VTDDRQTDGRTDGRTYLAEDHSSSERKNWRRIVCVRQDLIHTDT